MTRLTSALIDHRIDLDEIGRQEFHLQVETPAARTTAAGAGSRSGRTVSSRLALQVEAHRMLLLEIAQSISRSAALGGSSTRITSATALSATATSICGRRSRIDSRVSSCRERRDQLHSPARPAPRSDRGGNEAGSPLAKPDQRTLALDAHSARPAARGGGSAIRGR
jgi:hypothetical protein